MGRGAGGRELESDLQILVVSRVLKPLRARRVLKYFSVPNGGLRSSSEAMRLKREGVEPGIHDLVIIGYPHLAYFIEMKVKGGVVGDSQREVHNEWDVCGIPSVVCWSLDDVVVALRRWGFFDDDCVKFPAVLLPDEF